ncbi:MAG: CDP-alcohol phosphatidyltransferase family protein, partial [Gammaproteobacteria bacterium]
KALEQSKGKDGDTSLSGAVRILAAEGRANAILMDGFWIDVDDPAAFRKAEQALLKRLRDKPNDGPVARYLNRPLSVRISRYLVQHDVTPNQISLFSFLCSVLAAGLFMLGGYFFLIVGGVLAQFASIVDGCDGEVARLKYQSSDFGGWFDAVLDRYADAFLLFGLTWHLLMVEMNGWILLVGFMAIIGSFMLSYTADKYDKLMCERMQAGGKAGLRMGRDVRVFLIFLGAVANMVLPVLVLIAVVMNIETLRRVKMALDDQH